MKSLNTIKILFLVFITVNLAGCNKSASKKVEQVTAKTHEAVKTSKTHKISIAAMKFTPNLINSKIGDTLIFTNDDIVAHNVTQLPSKKWASPLLQPGDSWTFVPTASDSIYCTIHPTMKGFIDVE